MNTVEVARQAGIHKDTLLRWLRSGLVPEPRRDRRGWRDWSEQEAGPVIQLAKGEGPSIDGTDDPPIATLKTMDWDFTNAKTDYLTHSLHPYPAKFIPQIPNTLIQELSSVGDTILDPFCGSGTALVEALTLKRHAIGIDANPIASLISKAKTLRLSLQDIDWLKELEARLQNHAARFGSGQGSLFGPGELEDDVHSPTSEAVQFWFEPHVIRELAQIKFMLGQLETENSRTLAQAVFSSIIVSVSKQDSDTRYVRRDKNVSPGETVRRFQRALGLAITRAIEFTDLVEERFNCRVLHGDVLHPPSDVGPIDLVVCSPPYPNAYSYHLYHMTRMVWLDLDPTPFKAIEIGSHRKYSRKGPKAATVDTFRGEMTTIFKWLHANLRPSKYCCFVIGDSVLNGQTIRNNEVFAEIGRMTGFQLKADIVRNLHDGRKSFNPRIGKIKQEHILIFQNQEQVHG